MSNSFLLVNDRTTLKDLASYVGSSVVNSVLNVNNLKRQRNIGSQVTERAKSISNTVESVSWKRKQEIINLFSTDSYVF